MLDPGMICYRYTGMDLIKILPGALVRTWQCTTGTTPIGLPKKDSSTKRIDHACLLLRLHKWLILPLLQHT